MTNIEDILLDFETRTSLPSRASKEDLARLGARYLTTEPFNLKGKIVRYEQMQYQNGAKAYMWKRIVPHENPNGELFQIHLEISSEKAVNYPSK